MAEKVLDRGTIPFQAEGRLLQELGERLVARPEVALVELIKNAYDADSPSCEVHLDEGGKTLVISDKGHGMTWGEFSGKWMRIATASKLDEPVSRIYRRRLTGAKGIGRFAVRYLGDHLTHRGRTASCPAAPAQIPACSFSAPGSSEILASAIQPRPPKLPILPGASPQLGDVSLENAVAPL